MKNMDRKFINRDERLGDAYEFTLGEMIAMYREFSWDHEEYGDGATHTLSDEEIINEVLSMDIEEITAGR